MKPNEAYEILRNKMQELIIKQGAQKNESAIMVVVDAFIAECSKQSNYDQVACVNTICRMYDQGNVRAFASSIQNKDTQVHISSDKGMMAWCARNQH